MKPISRRKLSRHERTTRTATLQRRVGRPTKYSAAIAARICKSVREGCSREAAAGLAGVSKETLFDWMRTFSDFSYAIKKADSQFERECVARIRKAGRTPRNWTAGAWMLERKFPERYGKIERHLIADTTHGTPLPQDYIAAINEALGVRDKLEPLRENLLTEQSGNGHGVIDVLPQDEIDLEILPQD